MGLGLSGSRGVGDIIAQLSNLALGLFDVGIAPLFAIRHGRDAYAENGVAAAFTDLVTFSRASTGYAVNQGGAWAGFATDAPRISFNTGPRRQLIERAATNKITAYWSPTTTAGTTIVNAPGGAGVVTVVDDATALAVAGLSDLTNGKVYKLDNSGGTGVSRLAFNGTFNSTANFVMSVYMRGASGGESILLRTGYGSYSAATTATTAYVKLKEDYTTWSTGGRNAADVMWAEVGAGQVAYVCCPQAVEGTLVHSSPILVNGASATRATDATTKSLAAFDLSSALSFVFTGRLVADAGDYDRLVDLSDGTNTNRVMVYRDKAGNKTYLEVYAGGVKQGISYDLGVASGDDFRLGVSMSSAGVLTAAVNGTEKVAVTGLTFPALDRVAIGANYAAADVPGIFDFEDLYAYNGALSSVVLQRITA